MRRYPVILFFLFLFLFISTPISVCGVTRGIQVTSGKGKVLKLYKDYHAVVVGISDYEKWPGLPNAVKDAKEVASRLKELGFGQEHGAFRLRFLSCSITPLILPREQFLRQVQRKETNQAAWVG